MRIIHTVQWLKTLQRGRINSKQYVYLFREDDQADSGEHAVYADGGKKSLNDRI
jgi:hypothetical protein